MMISRVASAVRAEGLPPCGLELVAVDEHIDEPALDHWLISFHHGSSVSV